MLFPEGLINYEYDAVVNQEFTKLKLFDIVTKFIVLVFYPFDFSYVCPTELRKFSSMYEDFQSRDASVVYVSSDSVFSHKQWVISPAEYGGIGNIKWPMISDINRKLSSQFQLFNEKTGSVMRSTVILNSQREVIHISANADPIGRSTTEILRILDAYTYYENYGEVCSIDFKK